MLAMRLGNNEGNEVESCITIHNESTIGRLASLMFDVTCFQPASRFTSPKSACAA